MNEIVSKVVYCGEREGCTHAGIYEVDGVPYCGWHIRRHALGAITCYAQSVRKIQDEADALLARSEAGSL